MVTTIASDARRKIEVRHANTLTSIVRQAIEDMIISGELTAGDRINESALAERFGVSRGPIREACRSLEQAGLVRNVANQGAYVRELSLQEARDLYEVRGALSGLVGMLLAERITDSDIADLATRVEAMESMARADDFDSYYQANLAFHERLIAAAGNPALAQMYGAIVKQLHLIRRRGLVQPGRMRASNEEHRVIVESARRRDGVACSEATRRHIAQGWASFSATF